MWEKGLLRNSWLPGTYSTDMFSVVLGTYRENLSLALLPVKEPWQVAAFFPPCTAWNFQDVLTPTVHAALMRRWWHRYGAELVCYEDDTLELDVRHKPASAAEAMELAWELYLYAPDILYDRSIYHEGRDFDYLEDLADSLTRSSVWWISWD
jgi:hypothetical protein